MKVYFKPSTSYNRPSRKYKLKFWSKYYTLGGLQTLAHSFLEKNHVTFYCSKLMRLKGEFAEII